MVNKKLPWWGMCIFCSQKVFLDAYNSKFEMAYEETEYTQTRFEQLGEIMEVADATINLMSIIPDVPVESWLDFGDLSGLADVVELFKGIGEIVSGILEALSALSS